MAASSALRCELWLASGEAPSSKPSCFAQPRSPVSCRSRRRSPPEQQKRGEHSGWPAIAVLEGVDLQEHHHDDRNDQQGMQAVRLALLVQPIHQLRHQTGGIEGGNTVGACLVAAAVPGILHAVTEEDLVKLLDVALAERDLLPGGEHEVHQLAIASHLMLTARG